MIGQDFRDFSDYDGIPVRVGGFGDQEARLLASNGRIAHVAINHGDWFAEYDVAISDVELAALRVAA